MYEFMFLNKNKNLHKREEIHLKRRKTSLENATTAKRKVIERKFVNSKDRTNTKLAKMIKGRVL